MKRRKNGFNLAYFLSEGFHSIFSHGLMSFAAVCMVVACLLIMGSFSLVALNADMLLSEAEDKNEFVAYIEEDSTQEDIDTLTRQVNAIPNVSEVTFITREQAKETYLKDHEGEGLYANIPDSVFRDRLSIHVDDLKLFSQTMSQVETLDNVAWCNGESGLANGFVTIRNGATAVAVVLVSILAVVSLFIISNTIRLAAFTRREEIGIMKICGATDGFVRWPFIIEGLILGLIGAVIAFCLQWLLYVVVMQALSRAGVFNMFTLLRFRSIWPQVLGIFALAGSLIGMVGSGFAISRFLKV